MNSRDARCAAPACMVALRRMAPRVASMGLIERREAQGQEARSLVQSLIERHPLAPSHGSYRTDDAEHLIISHLPDGKPYLALDHSSHSLPWDVSISHSAHWLAVALSALPLCCGVDVEIIGDKAPRLLERFATAQELGCIAQSRTLLPQTLLAHLLWSAKETAYKIFRPTDGNIRSRFVLQEVLYDADQPLEVEDRASAALMREPIIRGELMMNCTPEDGLPTTALSIGYDYTNQYVLTWATGPDRAKQ